MQSLSVSGTLVSFMGEPPYSVPVSRMPEYESALADLSSFLVRTMMAALDPVLGQMEHRTVDHLPGGSVPDGVAIGFTHDINAQFRFVLDVKTLVQADFDAWAAMIHDAAEEGLSVVMPQFFAGLDEACRRAGTSVDASGRPLSWDTFLDGIAAIEIDFDDAGNPKLPAIVVSPSTLERMKMLPAFDETQNARFKQIIGRKKAAFDARRRVRRLA